LSVLVRPGNAGSKTADHITVLRKGRRHVPGAQGLDPYHSAGATRELLEWIAGQQLSYSVGFTLPVVIVDELTKIPERESQPAYDVDGEPWNCAWVLEVTGAARPSPGRPPDMNTAELRPTARR
jgi:hypothetical protein